jgi:hypothetical protein
LNIKKGEMEMPGTLGYAKLEETEVEKMRIEDKNKGKLRAIVSIPPNSPFSALRSSLLKG